MLIFDEFINPVKSEYCASLQEVFTSTLQKFIKKITRHPSTVPVFRDQRPRWAPAVN